MSNPTNATAAQAPPPAVARSIPAPLLLEAIQALGITHVLTVPDTHQKTLIAAIEAAGTPRLLTICAENEAVAINAGLWIGGQRPMLLFQHVGLLNSVNAWRALPLDAEIPTFALVGQFARDVTLPSRENRGRAVRMLEPMLEAWGVPYYRLEGPEDVPSLADAYRRCVEERTLVVGIVGARTS
jgi:sulfopyruvate decarboxylase TPP-binding subunit